jgi:Cu/Ag efflux protein CusF
MPRSLFRVAAASIGLAAALALPAQVQAAEPVQAQARGEVVRVNPEAGKIAIRHGAIARLDLPAMTLVYHIDPALLKGIAPGDTVSFTAERAGGQYRIVELKK